MQSDYVFNDAAAARDHALEAIRRGDPRGETALGLLRLAAPQSNA